MNRRHFLSTLGLGAVALATRTTLARRQSSARPPRVVTTKTNAYLIGKIEPVLTGNIIRVLPAPGGRYALINQSLRPEPTPETRETFGEEKLWLYDALRRTTKLIHRVQDEPDRVIFRSLGATFWFPDTKRALVLSSATRALSADALEEKAQVGIFEVERGTVRWLSGAAPELTSAQEIIGLQGLLLTGQTQGAEKVRFFSVVRSEGSLSPVVKIPYERLGPMVQGISSDGKRLILRTLNYIKVQERMVRQDAWTALEIASGTLTPLSEAPKDMIANVRSEAQTKLELVLSQDAAKLTGTAGRSTNTDALWLEAREPGPEKKFVRGLVTAEGGRAHLLADLSAVLYTHDDCLYAAPLASLDRIAFEKMRRELAMSNAKQTGLVLMMYAQDYDENLPHDPANVKEALSPYLKNRETLEDFVYTYKGATALDKIGAPSETALGYIPSPGGRAVVFADGHVKWESQLGS